MSLLCLCHFQFFPLCSHSLCVSPATCYVGPCGEFKMPGVTVGKEKGSWHFWTSYFIYFFLGGGAVVFVVCRVKGKDNYSRTLLFGLYLLARVSHIYQVSNQRFNIWLPKTGSQVPTTSLLPPPYPPPPYPHVACFFHNPFADAYNRVPTKANARNLTPKARSRTLHSPPSTPLFSPSPCSFSHSYTFVLFASSSGHFTRRQWLM